MLGSKRYPEFKTDETQLKAIRFLRQRDINALIVIGGDGSQAGALALSQKGAPASRRPAVSHRLLPESGVIMGEVKRALRAQDFDALAFTADAWTWWSLSQV